MDCGHWVLLIMVRADMQEEPERKTDLVKQENLY